MLKFVKSIKIFQKIECKLDGIEGERFHARFGMENFPPILLKILSHANTLRSVLNRLKILIQRSMR